MNWTSIILFHVLFGFVSSFPSFRPPAVPLVVTDPYVSVWSFADKATDEWAVHWSGAVTAFVGLIRIDGIPFRFLGPENQAGGTLPQEMSQTDVKVKFTSPVVFNSGILELDLDLLSRGVTYVDFDVVSIDKKNHDVSLYFDHTAEIAVNDVSENVVWKRVNVSSDITTMQIGTEKQDVLGERGDACRINWGFMNLAVSTQQLVSQRFSGALEARNVFKNNGTLPLHDDMRMPRACQDDWPVQAVLFDKIATTSSGESHNRWLILAYDDVYSIDFFGTKLAPYWKKIHGTIENLLIASAFERLEIMKISSDFDDSLVKSLTEVGGDEYAAMTSLVYRQVVGACKLTAGSDGIPRFFMKEISSDGDISTLDVIFPSSPLFLYMNPRVLYLLLRPVMEYAMNKTDHHYPFPWAPHHLGTWPIADIDASQQENMPIEETGNLIFMFSGIAKRLGTVDFIDDDEWQILGSWAKYLISTAKDPGDQLCTDDFEGPSPHNANLACKGIIGLGAYSLLLRMKGDISAADKYIDIARDYAKYWITADMDNTTSHLHFKLEYDKSNTWSLKYNMIWDQFLCLSVFPSSVLEYELPYYDLKSQKYGFPLDNRIFHSTGLISKWDWNTWGAALYDDEGFREHIKILFKYICETSTRVPVSDWYYPTTGESTGFRARPVVGAALMRLLLGKC